MVMVRPAGDSAMNGAGLFGLGRKEKNSSNDSVTKASAVVTRMVAQTRPASAPWRTAKMNTHPASTGRGRGA
jgi:hypothetical protein